VTWNGHLYKNCTAVVDYATAKADCEAQGYKLVAINDANEQTAVHDMIPIADQNNNNTGVWRWTGGTDPGKTGDWFWADGFQYWTGGRTGMAVNGSPFYWAATQPSNIRYCMAMEAKVGAWYGMDCAGIRPYICELY
jgi:hypothetical protein